MIWWMVVPPVKIENVEGGAGFKEKIFILTHIFIELDVFELHSQVKVFSSHLLILVWISEETFEKLI